MLLSYEVPTTGMGVDGEPERREASQNLDGDDGDDVSCPHRCRSPLCALTDGLESRNGIRKFTDTLPMMIAVVCQPVESLTSDTASSAQ